VNRFPSTMQTLPFANSLAGVTGIFAIFMFILRLIAPPLFAFVLCRYIASLFPREANPSLVIGTLFVVIATSSIFGHILGLSV
jgi:hypothetical protein